MRFSKPPPVFSDGAEDHQNNLGLEPTGDSLRLNVLLLAENISPR
jgi:hypothetical protein